MGLIRLFIEMFTRSQIRLWIVHAMLMPMPHVISVRVRPRLYRLIGFNIGSGVIIVRNLIIEIDEQGSYGNLVLGNNSYIGRDCFVGLNARVELEENAGLAPFCEIHVDDHDLGNPIRRMGPITSRPVKIGRGAFVGTGSVILAGVTIGEGAVIGARSVVTRDIPAHSIAVGSPAQVIKELGKATQTAG